MESIKSTEVKYCDLLNYSFSNDIYNVASYMTTCRKKAFFANPFLNDKNQTSYYLCSVNDIPVGRLMLFPTQIKAGDNLNVAESGSALEVHKDFRKFAIGVDIMMYWTLKDSPDFIIASGISEMALPVYKKLKYHIFEFPRMMMLRNSRSFLESKGLGGFLLRLSTQFINILLRIFTLKAILSSKKLMSKFSVKNETKVPDWVDKIVLNDGHKYMEVHNRKWLQWNLDYNFRGLESDIQSFYSVWYEAKPIAFFMTKERFREVAGGCLKNVVIGSIVEWGTLDSNIINEAELSLLSLKTFSKDLDIIELATDDTSVVRRLKKYGFIQHGNAYIVVKDKKNKMPKDFSDKTNWRIRYGYGDVLLT